MNKIIHYCWFGSKPLSKLTKRCIKSWKKYLPDYEIKLWNENNFDINSCEFIRQAYENKKWAFVADYVRLKVLQEYGGIYFDTDMEIIKDISHLLDKDLFIGVEDSGMVAAGVIGVKDKDNPFIKNMVQIYENFDSFNADDLYKITIPRLFTKELKENFGLLDEKLTEVKILEGINGDRIYIYPREYFYPLSYDYQDNVYTDNTCMVHHYDATWTSFPERLKLFLKRHNMKMLLKLFNFFVSLKTTKK